MTEAVMTGDVETRRIQYDDETPRRFILASVVFAVVALLLGVTIALQLAFPQSNLAPLLTYGRLRPLHTNAAIFAFVGNMIFAGIYYSTQRLVKARTASDFLSNFHFWGWQAIIVAATVSLPLGMTQGKEYAELEWPIDVAIALVWVVFAINFFWTLAKRNEKHLYVAIWFYIATIVTVAVLHIVNSIAIPVSFGKSYSVYGGAKDALVQWWYGHNAVAFFLTTPVLGIMYYYLPKAAQRPVYSYRLSIIHFWALVFVYIWAGPHHLLNTALPDWAQTLGMVFSLMLWAPSWGGMLNGLLTMRGAWDKVRADPVLKFYAAGVTFYGMATFEGPLLSIKSVSGLAHYTDWIVGHVHSGTLGWNGFMAAGMFYWLVPRLWGTELHSKKAAEWHFWLGTIGILLYMVSMWVSGVTQGLMWRATNPDGSLTYPSFVETLVSIRAMYWMRLTGGSIYFIGVCMMAWNLFVTMRSGKKVNGEVTVTVPVRAPADVPWTKIAFGPPVVLSALVIVLLAGVAAKLEMAKVSFIALASIVAIVGTYLLQLGKDPSKPTWHRLVEGRAALFTGLTLLAVLVGGVAEIVPSLMVAPSEVAKSGMQPYRPLELEGRDIYIREGCYTCHSQMIRPFVSETTRYGDPSTMEDSVWDHPFQWGSKRTGPDLAREGGRYPDVWHYKHMIDPRVISAQSNMPAYPHLVDAKVDFSKTGAKVRAMYQIGVPYVRADVDFAKEKALSQAGGIVASLKEQGVTIAPDSELVALIAYLQRLGVKAPEGGDAAKAEPTKVSQAPKGGN